VTTVERTVRGVPRGDPQPGRRVTSAIGGWLGALVGSVVVGWWIGDHGSRLYLGAVPFVGAWDVRLGPATLLPVAVAGAAVVALPVAAARLPWRWLLMAGMAAAALWAVALAMVDGAGALAAPLTTSFEYLVDVPAVRSQGTAEFLRTFTDRIDDYAVHTRGHPPGFVVLAAALDGIGLGAPSVISWLCIAAGASSVAAAAITLRAVATEDVARRAVPFLAVAPAAIWVATSADAFYLGVATWGIALVALSGRRTGAGPPLLAASGGLVLGLALHLSYGVAPLGGLALLLLRARGEQRRTRLLAATAGVAAILLALSAYGFFWPAGLAATHEQWALGVGPRRPQWYFLVANLAVFGAAIGPAAIAGLARLRTRGVTLLVAGGALAVAVADLSGMSRGEVERIWLPFTPWLLAATADLDPRRQRAWLAAQVGLAVLLQVSLRSKW
jgi:hypothetical protein